MRVQFTQLLYELGLFDHFNLMLQPPNKNGGRRGSLDTRPSLHEVTKTALQGYHKQMGLGR
eukprot:3084014-Prymnesium_polylepis.2